MSSQPGSVGTRWAANAAAAPSAGRRRGPAAARCPGRARCPSASSSGSAARLNGPGARRSRIRTSASATSSACTKPTGQGRQRQRQPPRDRPREPAGGAEQQRAEEVAADLAAGVGLQDQRRPDDGQRHAGAPSERLAHHVLGRGLVPAVLRGRDAGDRPVLGDDAGRRRPARRRRARTCGRRGPPRPPSAAAGDPPGAVDVHRPQPLRVPAGLQRPCQMHDGVDAVEELGQGLLALGRARGRR